MGLIPQTKPELILLIEIHHVISEGIHLDRKALSPSINKSRLKRGEWRRGGQRKENGSLTLEKGGSRSTLEKTEEEELKQFGLLGRAETSALPDGTI